MLQNTISQPNRSNIYPIIGIDLKLIFVLCGMVTWPAHETPRRSRQVFALCTIWTINFKYHVKLFAGPSTNAYATFLRYLKTWLIMFNSMVNCKAIAFFTFLSSSILYLYVVCRHGGAFIRQMWWALKWNDIDKESFFSNYSDFFCRIPCFMRIVLILLTMVGGTIIHLTIKFIFCLFIFMTKMNWKYCKVNHEEFSHCINDNVTTFK